MSVKVFVLKHPGRGYFVGYKRSWFLQRFQPGKLIWGEEPRFAYGITFHRTLQDARNFLIAHTEFPPETGIVEYLWE